MCALLTRRIDRISLRLFDQIEKNCVHGTDPLMTHLRVFGKSIPSVLSPENPREIREGLEEWSGSEIGQTSLRVRFIFEALGTTLGRARRESYQVISRPKRETVVVPAIDAAYYGTHAGRAVCAEKMGARNRRALARVDSSADGALEGGSGRVPRQGVSQGCDFGEFFAKN